MLAGRETFTMALASFAAAVALTLFFQSSASQSSAFHGTWTMEVARSDAAQQETFAGPLTEVISIADGSLVIETKRREKSEVMKYVLVSVPDQPGVVGA